jgi:hypothetical protein
MSSPDPSSSEATRADSELRDELARFLAPDAAPPELGALYAGLAEQIGRERGLRGWLRTRSTPARAALAAGAVLLAALGTALLWLRPDLHVYPVGRMALILGFGAALAGAQLRLALWPLQRPAPRRWLAPALIVGAIFGLGGVYALPAAHVDHAASAQAPGSEALLVRAWPCLVIGLALAGACYALLWALDRGGSRRALIAAACSGVSANLLLQLHCPITAPAHLLLGHLGVALAFSAAVTCWALVARWRA